MKIDISDKQVWATMRSLDVCKEALELIAGHNPKGHVMSWAGEIARDALAQTRIIERDAK